MQHGSLQGLVSVEHGREGVCISKRIVWQWAGSSGRKSTQLLSDMAASPTWKMSHSSKILQLSSLHYWAHSTEDLIEPGHPMEGTTVHPGTQQETQESSLVSPFPSFCFHPILQPGWPIFLEIPLDSITSMLCLPLPGSRYYTLVVHPPTVGLTITLYPLPSSKCFTHRKQS